MMMKIVVGPWGRIREKVLEGVLDLAAGQAV
jgi:hypothetical protein